MLELKNIHFERDNKKILDGINLNLEDDKFVVITGPNGSGKSTLAKIIMGIEKQDKGQVILNGKEDRPQKQPQIEKCPYNQRKELM